MIAELRAELELARQARLLRQIEAVERKLNILAARSIPRDLDKFFKLRSKLTRLRNEYRQPMLIYPQQAWRRHSKV